MKLSYFIPEPFNTLKVEYDKLKGLATNSSQDLKVKMAANKVFLSIFSCASAVVITAINAAVIYLSPTMGIIALANWVAIIASYVLGGESSFLASASLMTKSWSLLSLNLAVHATSSSTSLFFVAAAIGSLALSYFIGKSYQTYVNNLFEPERGKNSDEQILEEVEATNMKEKEDVKKFALASFQVRVDFHIKSRFFDHEKSIAAIIDYAKGK